MKHDRRVDHDHARDSIGVIGGEINREQRAERMPAHDHLVETKMIEKRDHVRGVIAHRVTRRRLAATPATAKIRSDDAMISCQTFIEKSAELVCIRGKSVQKNYRRVGAGII